MLSDNRIGSATRAASRANRLGKVVYWTAFVLFFLLTIGLVIGAFLVYDNYTYTYYFRTSKDWDAIWSNWGVLFAIWLAYSFGLAMIALVGSVAQAKAESLAIQIESEGKSE